MDIPFLKSKRFHRNFRRFVLQKKTSILGAIKFYCPSKIFSGGAIAPSRPLAGPPMLMSGFLHS
jgi:hypothetical protein